MTTKFPGLLRGELVRFPVGPPCFRTAFPLRTRFPGGHVGLMFINFDFQWWRLKMFLLLLNRKLQFWYRLKENAIQNATR